MQQKTNKKEHVCVQKPKKETHFSNDKELPPPWLDPGWDDPPWLDPS